MQFVVPGLPQPVSTVYFGGGTPSLLEQAEILRLMDTTRQCTTLEADAEVTLECNPDDVSADALAAWKAAGINRLSLGIQSFRDEDLRWMNRAHDASQARKSLELAREAGFSQLSADLIYGTPGLDDDDWREQIDILLSYGVPHISAYALTVEPRTALDLMIRKGKRTNPHPDIQASQFLILLDKLESAGYEHYEISNFAKPGSRSRHNSSYWSGAPYAGIGPSAHSYDGRSRRWNIAQNAAYIRSIAAGQIPFTEEILTEDQRHNEYVMTALRTADGIDLDRLGSQWGEDKARQLTGQAGRYIRSGHLLLRQHHLVLSREGKLFADGIAAALFI